MFQYLFHQGQALRILIVFIIYFLHLYSFAAPERKVCEGQNHKKNCNLRPKVSWVSEEYLSESRSYIFDASASTDIDGEIVKYEWIIDGVIVGTERILSFSFSNPGPSKISLKVTDNEGAFSLLSNYIDVPVIGTAKEMYTDEILILNLGNLILSEDQYTCFSAAIPNCLLKKASKNELTIAMIDLPLGKHDISFKIANTSFKHTFEIKPLIPSADSASEFEKFNEAIASAISLLDYYGYNADKVELQNLKNEFESKLSDLSEIEKSEVLTLLNKRLHLDQGFTTEKRSSVKRNSYEKSVIEILRDSKFAICTAFSLIASFASGVEAYKLHKDVLANNKRSIAMYAAISLGSVGLGIYCSNKFKEN